MSGAEMADRVANEERDVMMEFHRYRCCSADELGYVS